MWYTSLTKKVEYTLINFSVYIIQVLLKTIIYIYYYYTNNNNNNNNNCFKAFVC